MECNEREISKTARFLEEAVLIKKREVDFDKEYSFLPLILLHVFVCHSSQGELKVGNDSKGLSLEGRRAPKEASFGELVYHLVNWYQKSFFVE